MSKPDFSLNVEVRTDAGKGASRRLRRAGKVPGIVYGGHKDPVAVTLDHAELQNHLQHEAFYSHILQLKQGKEEYQAILKDLQRHPYKPIILHADFMRVSANEEIRVSVPLRFLNENTAVGVKMQGGTIFRVMTQIEVFCLPKGLPEFIEVDLADLEVGGLIHISDIKLPEGVRSVDLSHGPDHDQAVATIQAARVGEEAAEGEEGGEEASGE